MVSWSELIARTKQYLRFDRQELVGIIPVIFVTAFIFSFRDWGSPSFDLLLGLKNLILLIIVAGVSIFFRVGCQKVYSLSQGQKADFKGWFPGSVIALIVAFISYSIFKSFGIDFHIPLVLAGTVSISFMTRLRMGEFRYGYSYEAGAVAALWGIFGNLIMAILFAIGAFIVPQSYFFSKGIIINLSMAFCSLIPLPQLDGLTLYFGSKNFYIMGAAATVLAAVLLITRTKAGLIVAIVIGLISALVAILIGSEK